MPLATYLQEPRIVLILSIVTLFLGPLLHTIFKRQRDVPRLIDGFTLFIIIELVLVHLIPHAIQDIGWPAIVIATIGVLLPTYMERHMRRKIASQAHIFALISAMLALTLHTFTDGIALIHPRLSEATGLIHARTFLPFAITLHRFPEGLTVWWLLRPAYGRNRATVMLMIMAAATLAGAFVGQYAFGAMEHMYFGFLEAFVAGSLLHVVFHRHDTYEYTPATGRWEWASAVGALLGIAFIYLINLSDLKATIHAHLTEPAAILYDLALKSAPALVLAYLASGIIQGFFPATSVLWMQRGSIMSKAMRGMAFGLPLPICSCGVVPIYRSLIKRGVPLSAGLAFFVATPELGLDAILISIPLLGGELTLIRLVSAALVALLIGVLLGYFFKKGENAHKRHHIPVTATSPAFWDRLRAGLQMGFVDVVDHTAPWILLGLLIAALMHPVLTQTGFVQNIPDLWQVPVFALLGMPVYVCATGATPLVAVLILSGVSPGAAIAFLLTGPATNIATFGVLSQLHGRKLAITFAAGMAILSIALGYLVNLIFSGLAGSLPPTNVEQAPVPPYKLFFLIALAAIYLLSLLRRGPRYLINQIVAFEAQEK